MQVVREWLLPACTHGGVRCMCVACARAAQQIRHFACCRRHWRSDCSPPVVKRGGWVSRLCSRLLHPHHQPCSHHPSNLQSPSLWAVFGGSIL